MRHLDGWKWLEIFPKYVEIRHTVAELHNWMLKFNSKSLALIAFALFFFIIGGVALKEFKEFIWQL